MKSKREQELERCLRKTLEALQLASRFDSKTESHLSVAIFYKGRVDDCIELIESALAKRGKP